MFSKLSLQLICCPGYKDDFLVKGFKDIFSDNCETALSGYASVCNILFSSNKSLSDYIFFMIVNSNNTIMKNYISERTTTLFNAINNDISILSAVAATDAGEVISYLRNKFSFDDSLIFPVYEKGNTVISTEAVISYSERFGSALFAENKAFTFENGSLVPASDCDDIRLCDLKNYSFQRRRIIDNTICFINGKKPQNVLLYGDRGTGKSSTVKAIVNEYPELRIIQISKSSICDIYKIYDIINTNPLRFILFIDDITFNDGDREYGFLKQVLEGSVRPVPENCVIYATTNRRHIIKETESERSGDELHAADARDENMSLADRFGIYITFMSPDKNEYLDIVKQIASDRKLKIEDKQLFMLAERFALKKCGRSPRTAKQFVDMIEARAELGLELDNV